jgi:hypothetical protein
MFQLITLLCTLRVLICTNGMAVEYTGADGKKHSFVLDNACIIEVHSCDSRDSAIAFLSQDSTDDCGVGLKVQEAHELVTFINNEFYTTKTLCRTNYLASLGRTI